MSESKILLNDIHTIGPLLKDLRKKQKITQKELADYAGLSRSGLMKVESGQSDIKLSSLISISKLLGLDIVLKERGCK